jgi:long-subunit acyl-CoA synthetase (AMP-forming)
LVEYNPQKIHSNLKDDLQIDEELIIKENKKKVIEVIDVDDDEINSEKYSTEEEKYSTDQDDTDYESEEEDSYDEFMKACEE